MRVLLVNHFPLTGSGSGVYTYEVAKCLKSKGVEVALLYPENSQCPNSLSEYSKGVKNHSTDAYGIEHFVIFFNDVLGHHLSSASFNFPCFTSHPRSHVQFKTLSDHELSVYTQVLKTGLERAIEQFQPDLLHVQHIWIGAYLAMHTQLPYIITCHGTDLMGFEQMPHMRKMAIEAASHAQSIIAISNDVYDKILLYYGLSRHQVHLIHNGYNPSIFNLKEKPLPELLRGAQYITFAGKLTHFKGVDVLLEAAAIYEKDLPDLYTVIAGDGVLRETLMSQCEVLGLKRVLFVLHQPVESMAALFYHSQGHIIPSRGEPFGLVAVEAMASGAFLIGTSGGGLSDIIKEDLGVLIEPEDATALAREISKLICNPRSNLARKKSSQYAAAHFSWDMTVMHLLAQYEQALQIQYSDQLV